MIPRYTLPEMAAVFSDTARFGRYLEIELLATEAHAALGIVPKNSGGFGNVVDAARTFYQLEIVPIQQRMLEVNDWLGAPALAFKTYFAPQGIGADLIATRWGYSRDAVDRFALTSQKRAATAWALIGAFIAVAAFAGATRRGAVAGAVGRMTEKRSAALRASSACW